MDFQNQLRATCDQWRCSHHRWKKQMLLRRSVLVELCRHWYQLATTNYQLRRAHCNQKEKGLVTSSRLAVFFESSTKGNSDRQSAKTRTAETKENSFSNFLQLSWIPSLGAAAKSANELQGTHVLRFIKAWKFRKKSLRAHFVYCVFL